MKRLAFIDLGRWFTKAGEHAFHRCCCFLSACVATPLVECFLGMNAFFAFHIGEDSHPHGRSMAGAQCAFPSASQMASRASKPHGNRQSGMTLIEIIVVLAIIGALLAMTAPTLNNYFMSLEFRTRTDKVSRDIARLRQRALLERRLYYFPQTDEKGRPSYEGLSEPLPLGWRIEGEPIVFFATGACAGGELTIVTDTDRRASFRYAPPQCRAERIEGADTH